ncbi:uncharacterized protein LOC116182986 isoform X1 [Photinus pyralis]|nr:uncharacterized protein LOC116158935 isoform X1 [Photinus pyralis]XP_031327667.1 uncharacterized protein LOC116158935 isoform X1 [Photinus pyralis]XP_031359435.1 uncharacterized protein LOC116182986 isoform X1 [Photinus pyralis]XP_031359436.1 uncharacterized protein LOC116182986 isoform X1 [Photinus pyralis]
MMDEFINSKSSCYIDSDISNAGSVRDCSDNEISGDDSEDRSLVYEQSDMDISEDTDLEELCYEKATANSSLFKTSGRRIVNISYLFSQLKSLKHEGFNCSFFDLNLVSEKIEGLHSVFSFKCEVCNIIQNIRTEDPDNNVNVNLMAAIGCISAGIGYSQLSEILASLDVPNMSHTTYSKHHNQLFSVIQTKNEELMVNAGKEEALLAKTSGEVNSKGIPIISVIVDGAWSKRSYRTNYNALSGVACIIGAKTKKLLYIGVRNKYCYVCARATVLKDHDCFQNWHGTSTSMEADIIVEGFKKSVKTHNLIYGRVIGDGDSSVYRKLTEAAPYGPTFVIQKIECRNHLLRNYLNKISEISKDSNFPIALRKKVTNSDTLGRFRNAVTKAIEHRKNENKPFDEKTNSLKGDILNGPKHIFGDHSACDDYFCKGGEENLVPDLQSCGLYNVVKSINMRLANNAASLLHDVDTKAAETYNAIVAKFVGGKRINFSLKNSYQIRCMAAAISYNSSGSFMAIILEELSELAAGTYLEKYLVKRSKAREIRRQGKCVKRKKFATTDRSYGPEASNIIADMDLHKKV